MADDLKTIEPEGIVSEAEIVEDDAVVSFYKNENLLNKSMKIMEGKHGGAFYVRYIFDSSKGCGWLQLIVEYPTGAIQTRLLCKNVCKESTFEEDGIGEVVEKTTNGTRLAKPFWEWSRYVGDYSIMRDIERPDMPIPLMQLWRRIQENYAGIPIVELEIKTSLEEVYEKLLLIGSLQEDRNEGNYYLITKEELTKIAEECGYTLAEVRTEFALRGLWECDKNSGGYQKTKKVLGANRRFYALKRKIRYEAKPEIKVATDTTFHDSGITIEDEKEIEELKKKVSDAEKKAQDMTKVAYRYAPSVIPQEDIHLFI